MECRFIFPESDFDSKFVSRNLSVLTSTLIGLATTFAFSYFNLFNHEIRMIFKAVIQRSLNQRIHKLSKVCLQ